MLSLSTWGRLDEAALGIEKRGLGDLLAQDVALDEIRKPDLSLVLKVHGSWNREDLCEMC